MTMDSLPFKKILLTGSGGQLGRAFRSVLPSGFVCTDLHGENSCDLADSTQLIRLLDQVKPDLIINPAAYTATDKAESEESIARAVNAVAPSVMARWAAAHDAVMIHYSTDYVFDGKGTKPWTEHDRPAPLNVYGQTKLAGENAVLNSGARGAIFRTSWVYSDEGHNFVKTMLRLAAEREELRMVADQIGAPTSAHFLTQMTWLALTRGDFYAPGKSSEGQCKVFHLVPRGEVSWHGFAEAIIEKARQAGLSIKAERVTPIATSDYPTPARRPLNSRLDCTQFEETFGVKLDHWHVGFDGVMGRILRQR